MLRKLSLSCLREGISLASGATEDVLTRDETSFSGMGRAAGAAASELPVFTTSPVKRSWTDRIITTLVRYFVVFLTTLSCIVLHCTTLYHEPAASEFRLHVVEGYPS
jgi:hypothetical protein